MSDEETKARWPYIGRGEWACEHGVGHGHHPHGCDGCCKASDFPAKDDRARVDDDGEPDDIQGD